MSVRLGHFDALLALGLAEVLRDDCRLNVFAGGVESSAFADAAQRAAPCVTILSDAAGRVVSPPLSEPGSGVVVLAREPTLPYGMTLLAAGVSCLAWSVTAGDVLAAIHLTAQGGCMLVCGESRVERSDRSKEGILTQREIQVLGLLSDGQSPGAISHELGISLETVKKHTRSLLFKLKAPTKRHLIGLPIQWLE